MASSPASRPPKARRSGARACIDDRDVPARPHPHRRGEGARWASGRCARGRPLGDARAIRVPPRSSQDRDPAKARRQHHHLVRARRAGRRRPAGPVLVPDRSHHHPSGGLSRHRHDVRDPCLDPRQPPPRPDVLGQIDSTGPRYCPRSRTRSCASLRGSATRYSSSPRVSTTIRYTRTGFRRRSRARFNWRCCAPFPASSARSCGGLVMRSSTISWIRGSSRQHWRRGGFPAVPRRADQRHDRV